MIRTRSPNVRRKLDLIYRHNAGIQEPIVPDILELMSMFNTGYCDDHVLGKSYAYWEFLKDCLNNFRTGHWKTLPEMWLMYCKESKKDSDLAPFQIAAEVSLFRDMRFDYMRELKLPNASPDDRAALLFWLSRQYGERDMLRISNVLLKLHYHFITDDQGDVDTAEDEDDDGLTSFNNANDGAPATVGGTKVEVLKNFISTPLKDDERMV